MAVSSLTTTLLHLLLLLLLYWHGSDLGIGASQSAGKYDKYVVSTESGKVRGMEMKSVNERPFAAFLGIPYAKAPIMDLRFKYPVPPDKWNDIRDGTKDGSICMQINRSTRNITGSEDCLFINVYTPNLPSTSEETKLLPVMVYVHGGAFAVGNSNSATLGPQRLMDRDIIYMSFNYRIDALGFLSTGDESILGNFGLHDQVAALKWVQTNIKSFGGDPSRVTIFGESAGGAAVTFLVLSPLTKGLFQNAISQSGSATCDWGINENPLKSARRLATKLRCRTHPTRAMYECLKLKSPQEIIQASYDLAYILFFPMHFTPTVDVMSVTNGFLPEHPRKLLEEGRFNKVPLMIGLTEDEGVWFSLVFQKVFGRIGEVGLQKDIPEIIAEISDVNEPTAIASVEEIRKRYFSGFDLESDKTKFRNALFDIFSDSLFAACIDDTYHTYTKLGVPTYGYKFTHRGEFSLAEFGGATEVLGVSHGDDLQYLFESATYSKGLKSEADKQMSNIFLDLWTNFAYYGNPTPSDKKGRATNFVWLPNDKSNPQYLDLNLKATMKSGRFSSNTDFWMNHFKL